MKKITNYLLIILLTFIITPLIVNAKNNKVKVYMFEAGGCPYCEAQEEYLKGLDSYNEKFELVKKELYKDHVDWAEGKDYELGVKVAKSFKDAGFEDASAEATPFVVISDLYAVAGYDTSLEEIINKAYDEGDKDAVSCIEKDGTNCIRSKNEENKENNKTSSSGDNLLVILTCSVILLLVYVLKSNYDKKEILEAIDELNNKKTNKKD